MLQNYSLPLLKAAVFHTTHGLRDSPVFLLMILIGFPFLSAFLFEIIALPKGYRGIRNEQLLQKYAGRTGSFDMYKFKDFEVREVEEYVPQVDVQHH